MLARDLQLEHDFLPVRTRSRRACKKHKLSATLHARPGFVGRIEKGLPISTVEVVVGRVGDELSLTHSAGTSWGRSSIGIKALDKGDFGQQSTTRWPVLISD